MRKPRNLQVESSAGTENFRACPNAALVEEEITALLESIPWGPGDQLTATKLAQVLGVHVSRIIRPGQKGTSIRSADGTRGYSYLAMTRRFGEWWVSRRAFELYMRQLNGLDAPSDSAASAPRRRSAKERARAIAEANALAKSLGS